MGMGWAWDGRRRRNMADTAMQTTSERRHLASDPATPPETLSELARIGDASVRAAIACNPNTPVKTLLDVGSDYPHEFLRNPALPLLLLEQPDLPERLQPLVPALLRCEEAPATLLRALAASASLATGLYVLDLINLHVQSSGELPTSFEQDSHHEELIWSGLIEARHISGKLMKLYTLPDFLPPWFLALLAEATHWDWTERDIYRIREGLARCPDTPASILCDLGARKYKGWRQVHRRLALHPRTPPDILALLSRDYDIGVDRALAYNPHTPTPTLETLATFHETAVRRAVARNIHTPPATLHTLALDREEIVRLAVARQRYTPAATLLWLAQDESPQVRAALAHNRSAPSDARDLLEQDADPLVRAALIAPTPKYPPLESLLERIEAGHDLEAVVALARHFDAPADHLNLGYYESFGAVRLALASNPGTPPNILERMAITAPQDKLTCSELRLRLARNPSTPLHVLEHLCDDYRSTSPDIAHAVVHHPRVGGKRRSAIYRRYFESVFAYDESDSTTWLEYPALRLLALASAHLTPDVYQCGAESRVWIERYIVARNPVTPHQIVESLTHDGHAIVRSCARTALAQREALQAEQSTTQQTGRQTFHAKS